MIATTETSANNGLPDTNSRPAKERRRKEWSPNADDLRVYEWIKFGGKKQEWVAYQLGISQATVCRIVQRYERWQAHADDRDGGRLDLAERLRAQRWLTFERNERMLASALRIADDMEGFIDVSKSVTSRPTARPSQESETRTENAVVDRSGIAARFLRLAFRINMEQLKLTEAEPAPKPAPLSVEQIATEQQEAGAADQEFQERQEQVQRQFAREAELDQRAGEGAEFASEVALQAGEEVAVGSGQWAGGSRSRRDAGHPRVERKGADYSFGE